MITELISLYILVHVCQTNAMRFAMILNSIFIALLAAWNLSGPTESSVALPIQADSSPQSARFRPNAVELDPFEAHLVVAGGNGELAVIDTSNQELLSTTQIGVELVDLTKIERNGEFEFLSVDRQNHELISFHLNSDPTPEVNWRLNVSKFPNQIAVGQQGLIAVAGLWSRKLTLIHSADSELTPKILGHIELDFAPGQLVWLNEHRNFLLVVGAFGNQQAVIHVSEESIQSGKLDSDPIKISRSFPDRRVGGIAASDGKIVMATQMLNPLAHSNRNDVHWGLMLSNDIETFDQKEYLADTFDFSKHRVHQPIGGAGDAKSDPERVVLTKSNMMIIVLGGANQIAVGSTREFGFAYLYAGNRPVDVALSKDEKSCYVANQLDDSISLMDIENLEKIATVRLGTTEKFSLEEQGERLFYDASLSHDGWMSCHSCHVNGHTSGLANDNMSDGTFGTPKQIISLLGHGGTEPMAWNGDNQTLEKQIHKSLEVTMQSDKRPDPNQVKAIAAFVRQLPAPPSLSAARDEETPERVAAGKLLFHQLDCIRCHAPPSYTSPQNYSVGLEDEKGLDRFNPPSLIGLSQRDTFFHDGRITNLEEVFTEAKHQVPDDFLDQQRSDLMAFLNSL